MTRNSCVTGAHLGNELFQAGQFPGAEHFGHGGALWMRVWRDYPGLGVYYPPFDPLRRYKLGKHGRLLRSESVTLSVTIRYRRYGLGKYGVY
jgi:hypothetical protein